MAQKFVYLFSEGDASMRNLLGGKGANLAEMTKLGIPVPPGFIVSTEACGVYNSQGKVLPADIKSQIDLSMADVEKQIGKKLAVLGHYFFGVT